VIAILGSSMHCRDCRKSRSRTFAVVPQCAGPWLRHNLLGSGAALAAVAVMEYMAANHVAGTLRY